MIPMSRRLALLCGAAFALAPGASAAAPAVMTIHKDPNCDCCVGWVKHLGVNGLKTTVVNTPAVDQVKKRLGVPQELYACHTGELAGYAIEGHVPAAAIKRLLAERPKAIGIAVPGMPGGSPGMGGAPEEYDVILFAKDGTRRTFGRFKGDKAV